MMPVLQSTSTDTTTTQTTSGRSSRSLWERPRLGFLHRFRTCHRKAPLLGLFKEYGRWSLSALHCAVSIHFISYQQLRPIPTNTSSKWRNWILIRRRANPQVTRKATVELDLEMNDLYLHVAEQADEELQQQLVALVVR
jgi:hypothetical protein